MSSPMVTAAPAMKKKPSLEQRIRDAYAQTRDYHRMLELVFPASKYPRAWRYSSNGGPPGCAMTFGNALRKMGGYRDHKPGGQTVYIPPSS